MTETMPHDIEAEKALIGCLLSDADACYHDVTPHIPSDTALYDIRHRLIYRAVRALAEDMKPVDPITVRERLESLDGKDMLEDAGGVAYLQELSFGVDSVANAGHYAERVASLSLKRKLIGLGYELQQTAGDATATGQAALEMAEQFVRELGDRERTNGDLETMQQTIDATLAALESDRTRGILTGYADYDRGSGGLKPGNLLILAARPSMGKTAFALNLMHQLGRRGTPVALFSLEMSCQQIGIRSLSYEAGVNSMLIQTGNLQPDQRMAIRTAASALPALPLHFDDRPSLTLSDMRYSVRRAVRKSGIRVVILDYLQLMTPPKAERNDLAVGQLSRGLKAIAKEQDVCLIALSQLNRSCEQRENKRPIMSDLRESGAIEQDADEICFLYRDCVYNPTADPNEAELIVRKRRDGPIGTVRFWFDKATGRFSETVYERQTA